MACIGLDDKRHEQNSQNHYKDSVILKVSILEISVIGLRIFSVKCDLV